MRRDAASCNSASMVAMETLHDFSEDAYKLELKLRSSRRVEGLMHIFNIQSMTLWDEPLRNAHHLLQMKMDRFGDRIHFCQRAELASHSIPQMRSDFKKKSTL